MELHLDPTHSLSKERASDTNNSYFRSNLQNCHKLQRKSTVQELKAQ